MKVNISLFDRSNLLMSHTEDKIKLYAGNVTRCDEGSLFFLFNSHCGKFPARFKLKKIPAPIF